jgi:hypothetical protein
MKESTAAQRHGERNGKAANGAAQPQAERRSASFDNVADRWRQGWAQAGVSGELGASETLLRASLALQEVQAETVRRMQQAHTQAQAKLGAARSPAELARVGLELAQSEAEQALSHWSRTADIALRSAVDGWSAALALSLRAQAVSGEAGRHWLDAVTQQRPVEATQAQLDQLATPAAALPLLWPAQESVRQALTLGARAWNDWLAALPTASRGERPTTTH